MLERTSLRSIRFFDWMSVTYTEIESCEQHLNNLIISSRIETVSHASGWSRPFYTKFGVDNIIISKLFSPYGGPSLLLLFMISGAFLFLVVVLLVFFVCEKLSADKTIVAPSPTDDDDRGILNDGIDRWSTCWQAIGLYSAPFFRLTRQLLYNLRSF